jgi:hypothetical protein
MVDTRPSVDATLDAASSGLVLDSTAFSKSVRDFDSRVDELFQMTWNAMSQHEDAAQGYTTRRLVLAMASTIFATGGGVSALFNGNRFVSGILSLIAALLVTVNTVVDPSEQAKRHKAAADQFADLTGEISPMFEESQNLLNTSKALDRDEMNRRYIEYRSEYHRLERKMIGIKNSAPAIPGWVTDPYFVVAWWQAVKARKLRKWQGSSKKSGSTQQQPQPQQED